MTSTTHPARALSSIRRLARVRRTDEPGNAATTHSPLAAYLIVGGVAGLAWAASLRGWMAELVHNESRFTWLTIALVLLPGVAVGVLIGRAVYRRATGGRADRRLVFAPVLLLTALLDPEIFRALVTTGEGGGAIWVVITALATGHALSRRHWSVARVLTAAVTLLGLVGMAGIGTMAGPWTSARGAWVSLYGLSVLAILCLASVLPYPAVRPPQPARVHVAVGAAVGLAWACALRAFMAQVAGAQSTVGWVMTFGFVLLPGAVVGGLLGLAEHRRRTADPRGRRALGLAPFAFAAVLVPGVVQDPAHLFTDGIGGGALALPALGIVGGYALAGRGRWAPRLAAAVVAVAALLVWPVVGVAVGGPSFAPGTPHGLWATLLYDALIVVLMLAASIPRRQPRLLSAMSVPAPSRAAIPGVP